jgi:predicted transcriptional regulator
MGDAFRGGIHNIGPVKKISVSLPEALLTQVDALATRLGLSRSEVYERALTDFLLRQSDDAVAAALNRLAAGQAANDTAYKATQRSAVRRTDWM